jgi:ketosteroid isomerase-like protein
MNSTNLKELVIEFFQLLNKKELENLNAFLSPAVIFYFPGTKPLSGPQKVIQLFKIIFRKYPDLLFRIKDVIIEENKVAVSWTNSGTDKNNIPYQNEGVTLFRIEHGYVTYISDYFKDTSFTQM